MDENAEFIARLQQIEELAHSLGAELQTQQARTRAQHIAILARSLRGRLELGRARVLSDDTGSRVLPDDPGAR